MYYIGMETLDVLDIIETKIYNEEIKELIEYFCGDNYSMIFAINGAELFIKRLYKESLIELARKWKNEANYHSEYDWDIKLEKLYKLLNI